VAGESFEDGLLRVFVGLFRRSLTAFGMTRLVGLMALHPPESIKKHAAAAPIDTLSQVIPNEVRNLFHAFCVNT